MSDVTAPPITEEKKKESTRRTFRNDGWTAEQVSAKKAELTVTALPEGWIKLAEVSKVCRLKGIPVSKFVKCTGGDRGMNPVIDPTFKFVYFNGARYLAPDILTKGIALLENPEFAKLPRKPREKKAKAEGAETGAVKGAKKEKKSVVPEVAQPKKTGMTSGIWEAPK